MPIHYSLVKNPLSSKPNEYYAVVHATDRIGLKELTDMLVASGTTVNRPDILAVLDGLFSLIERCVADGARVNLGGLVELFGTVRGTFEDLKDSFQPDRHRLVPSSKTGRRLRNYLKDHGQVKKVPARRREPNLLELRDYGSQTNNTRLTPGNIGELHGGRLKFNPDADDEGIFFISVADGTETRVPAVATNKPKRLTFLIPPLSPGEYRLQVRSRPRHATDLRTGLLPGSLVVPS